jgi:ferredoxin--NADP+ reductase
MLKFQGTHTGFDPYQVLEVRHLTPRCFVLRVDRRDLSFRAGQCFNVGPVGEGVNREYSIYSGESANYLEFLVKVVEDGAVSPKLQKLQKGDRVEIAGPYGLFSLNQKDVLKEKYVFIGTGTGIAPFHSFTKTYPGLNYRVIHGVRMANETYDSQAFETSRYQACVSREESSHFKGRVNDYLKTQELDLEANYYLCGNRMMISQVFDELTQRGVSGDRIFTETFF